MVSLVSLVSLVAREHLENVRNDVAAQPDQQSGSFANALFYDVFRIETRDELYARLITFHGGRQLDFWFQILVFGHVPNDLFYNAFHHVHAKIVVFIGKCKVGVSGLGIVIRAMVCDNNAIYFIFH